MKESMDSLCIKMGIGINFKHRHRSPLCSSFDLLTVTKDTRKSLMIHFSFCIICCAKIFK